MADAYDAIVTDRPYRKGRAPWQALAEIEACAGTQFDPDVVQAFKRVLPVDTIEPEQELVGVPTAGGNGRSHVSSTIDPESLRTLDDLSSALDAETQD